jgi:acetyl esterase/lipase
MNTRTFFSGMLAVISVASLAGSPAFAQEKAAKTEKKTPAQKLPAEVKKLADITYKEAGDLPLKLDLYLPEKTTGKLPVVVWVHGGGWNQGSKDRCPAVWLVTNGFAVASIQYRLSTQAQWPAQIEDCRDAVRWLRDNAAKHQLDGDHIGAWGSSAGGHLVALLGTLDTPKTEKTSSRVQAVCDWFGPSDLLTMPANVIGKGRTEADVAKSNGAQLLGAPIYQVPAKAKLASAFYQISPDDAPFLIMHGDADPQVPLEQSTRFHERLKETGVRTELTVIKGGVHGGPLFNTPEIQQQVLQFFTRELKPKK